MCFGNGAHKILVVREIAAFAAAACCGSPAHMASNGTSIFISYPPSLTLVLCVFLRADQSKFRYKTTKMYFRQLLQIGKTSRGQLDRLIFTKLSNDKIETTRIRCFSSRLDSNEEKDKSNVTLDQQLLHHLERTSLVDFDSEEAVKRLTEAIKFADQLMEVNTEGVEPLYTVLEDQALYLREDKPEKSNREKILHNASITEEDYFVAPPGNIPLEPSTASFIQEKSSKPSK